MSMVPKKKTLCSGTRLFHGTNCVGDFIAIDGPAWLAFDETKAEEWAGWRPPPPDREIGPLRVISFIVTEDVALPDVASLADWQALALACCHEEEPFIWTFADAVQERGLLGWYSHSEVMLCSPSLVLRKTAERAIAKK